MTNFLRNAAFLATLVVISTYSFAIDHTTDSLETIEQNLADDVAVLVDVREQNEWDAGHIEYAFFAPLSVLSENEWTAEQIFKEFGVSSDKIIYIYCRSGRRALIAGDIFVSSGFDDVRPLRFGFLDLANAGFPVE